MRDGLCHERLARPRGTAKQQDDVASTATDFLKIPGFLEIEAVLVVLHQRHDARELLFGHHDLIERRLGPQQAAKALKVAFRLGAEEVCHDARGYRKEHVLQLRLGTGLGRQFAEPIRKQRRGRLKIATAFELLRKPVAQQGHRETDVELRERKIPVQCHDFLAKRGIECGGEREEKDVGFERRQPKFLDGLHKRRGAIRAFVEGRQEQRQIAVPL